MNERLGMVANNKGESTPGRHVLVRDATSTTGSFLLNITASFTDARNVVLASEPAILREAARFPACQFDWIDTYELDDFENLRQQVGGLARLPKGWDSYGADPPNETAIKTSSDFIGILRDYQLRPTKVSPSAEGGVGICFERDDKYADIEFLNDGDVVAVKYRGQSDPEVWEVAKKRKAYVESISRIREHLEE